MSLGLIAAMMAALLLLTVVVAVWRCDHPYRIRYRRCAQQRHRAGIGCRQMPRH